MKPLTYSSVVAVVAYLSLGACRENQQEEDVSDRIATSPEVATSAIPATAPDESASSGKEEALRQEIIDLKSDIESSEQAIESLDTAVLMERDKLDENPDYDPSFLNEFLQEQEQERLEIEKARLRIEMLTGSEE